MTDNEIFDQLNDPEFSINISKLLYRTHQLNRLNNEYLKEILQQQFELKELLKGNIGQEAESNAESKFEKLNSEIYDYVNKLLMEDLNYSSLD